MPTGIGLTTDPLVRSVFRWVARCVLFGVLIAATAADAPTNVPVSQSSVQRSIAWVDYPVAPARAVFDTFSVHFAAHSRGALGALRYVGADVTHPAQLNQQMVRLVREHPALIVATSVTVAQSLQSLHTGIPVYFIIQSDPIRDGLVRSLRSTGPLTGYTFFVPLDVKTMEIIRRVFPGRSRVGVVADGFWLEGRNMSADFFEQCIALGMQVTVFEVETDEDIEHLRLDRRVTSVDVWYIPYSVTAFLSGSHIASVLAKTGVATVYARRKFLKDGGLLSVQAVDPGAMNVWARGMTDILSGVPLQDMPVMRPKEIEVAVNAREAARLDAATRERIAREATRVE